MKRLTQLYKMIQALFHKRTLEEGLSEELRFHLDCDIEKNLQAGMSLEEAREAALREFGGVEQTKEKCRDSWGTRLLEEFWQDLRYSLRHLRLHWLPTVIMTFILGIGIGINSGIFSLIESIFLRPLPVPDPGGLAVLYSTGSNYSGYDAVSYPDFLNLHKTSKTLSNVAAYARVPVKVKIQGKNRLVSSEIVSKEYFSVMGIHPLWGRTFGPQDSENASNPPGAVVNEVLWSQLFGTDRGLSGRSLLVNNREYAVLGVLPQSFKGINLDWGRSPQLWLPLSEAGLPAGFPAAMLQNRNIRWLLAVGRIVPPANLQSAQMEMKTIARQLEQTYPVSNDKRSILLLPAQQARFWPAFREPILVLMRLMQISGFLLLLIVCLTVANLLLSQLAARRKEMGIRMALGSGARRLMRQLLTETLVLSMLGAGLGSFLSIGMIRIFPFLPIPYPIPLEYEPRYNFRVFLFSLLIAVACTLAVGIFPAIHSIRQNLFATLKSATQPAGGWKRYSVRHFLIAAQIAVSLALSISAGLLARSFWHLKTVNPGIDPAGLTLMELSPMELGGPLSVGSLFYREVIPFENRWPQLQRLAAAADTPFSRIGMAAMRLRTPDGSKEEVIAFPDYVSPEYFQTIGLELISGREFTRLDVQNKSKALIVNRTLAQQIWHGQDPLGRKLFLPKDSMGHEIIGVVKDLRHHDLWESPRPRIYLPFPLDYDGDACILLRMQGDPRPLLNALSQQIIALDDNISIQISDSMSAQLAAAVAQPKMTALFSSLTAILTVFLAGLGLFGVMAQMVLAGSREIGLRIALGARPNDICRLVARAALFMLLGGVVAGIPLALGLAQILAHQLHGISKTDALTFFGVPILMAVIVFFACYIPVHRAIRVDPLEALWWE